jgi:hypothetical protein
MNNKLIPNFKMKNLLTSWLVLLLVTTTLHAQSDSPYTKDVKNIDNIIFALYESISGEATEERDWERFKYLFAPDAKLIPTARSAEGKVTYRYWTPQEYVDMFTSSRRSTGFFEIELERKTEEFANIAHVFSTYATMEVKNGPVVRKGINSIQLIRDKNRYYIINIFWSNEEGEERIKMVD